MKKRILWQYPLPMKPFPKVKFLLEVYVNGALLNQHAGGGVVARNLGPFEAACGWIAKPRMIVICVNSENLKYEFVGHECYHAACRYGELLIGRGKRARITGELEEDLAHVSGCLLAEIVHVCQTKGKAWKPHAS